MTRNWWGIELLVGPGTLGQGSRGEVLGDRGAFLDRRIGLTAAVVEWIGLEVLEAWPAIAAEDACFVNVE